MANGAVAGSVYSVSSNGQYIAFASTPGALLAGSVSAYRNVFVCDSINGTNILVSADTNGLPNANGWSTDPVISGDGRYVAFASSASNLVAGGTNTASDIFLRDLQMGTTTLLSQTNSSQPAGNYSFTKPAMSQDGRYLLYHSQSSSGTDYLLWRDTQQPTNVLVTSVSGNVLATMTPNGRYVVYAKSGLKLWDSQGGTTAVTAASTVISNLAVSVDGTKIACRAANFVQVLFLPANTNVTLGSARTNFHSGFQFSADDHYLAYLAADSNNITQVYIYNLQSNSNLLVSQAYNASGGGNGNCDYVVMSADGRFVAYRSAASNLAAGDTNGLTAVFLYDQTTSLTTLVSANEFGTGAGNGESLGPVFTADAQTFFLQTWASDLSAQDFNPGNSFFAVSLYSNPLSPTLGLGLAGQAGTVSWYPIIGKTYHVQFKNSLSESHWQNLNSGITIVGNRACLVDPAPPGTQRFYRVVSN